MQRLAFALALIAVSSCAAYAPSIKSPNYAELSFSHTSAPGGLPGKFDSIDGKRFEGSPISIRVAEGTRKIVYSCPDVISVDSTTHVTASFVAGRRYVLDCSANMTGVVREQ